MVVVHVSLLFNNVFIFNPSVAIVFHVLIRTNVLTLHKLSHRVNTAAHWGKF